MEVSGFEDRIAEELTPIETEGRYREFLDEVYGEIDVCGYKYDAGRLLELIDPVAFRCGMNDWIDSECSDDRLVEVNGEFYATDEVEEIIND